MASYPELAHLLGDADMKPVRRPPPHPNEPSTSRSNRWGE